MRPYLLVALLALAPAHAQGPVPGVDPVDVPLLDVDAADPFGRPTGKATANPLSGAISAEDQAVVDQGVEDWQNIHSDVLAELRRLGASEDPDDQLLFAQKKAELMRAVAGPLFDAAGLRMPGEDEPEAAQQMLRSLLQKVGDMTGGGAAGLPDASTGLSDLAGDGPASSGWSLPTGMGAIQKLLQGIAPAQPPASGAADDLWIGPPGTEP
jgi:hypothetical protein